MGERSNTFDDIVDAYMAYLQITVVNPAMEKALAILEKFACDAHEGKIFKDKLRFGAPWRRPPLADSPTLCLEWAKLQLMDFVQCVVNAEFGVGLLYTQRDPSFICPISRGIQRCSVRWLVQERMQMDAWRLFQFVWHRFFRGRSYGHPMLQIGCK